MAEKADPASMGKEIEKALPPKPKDIKIPNSFKYLFGGSAGMAAACFVQPLEVLKNRMQLQAIGVKGAQRQTSLQIFQGVIKNEGYMAIFDGLSAALLRQATYTTTRLGTYTFLFEKMSKDGKPPNFLTKAACGIFAGACGAFVGCPPDVCLIRMCADGRLPLNERRNYKNVIDAMVRITREEGVTTLWRGAVATMNRAMVVNALQLATYSQVKQALLGTGWFTENLNLYFWSSMVSGLVTSIGALPVDIAKTRVQNMKIIDGRPEYKNGLDVFRRVIAEEGVLALWKGFTPFYFRLGPHTVLTLIFLEQFNNAYYRYHGVEPKRSL